MKHQKTTTEDLSERVAQARKLGLEAGWTGSDDWPSHLTETLCAALRLKEKQYHGDFGPEPSALSKRMDTLRERKEQLDAFRASYRGNWLEGGRSSRETQWQWDLRRMVTIVALVALAGVILSMVTANISWQAFVALTLAGALIAFRPWGVASSIRMCLFRAEGDLGYLLQGLRSRRLARQIEALRKEIHREEKRRDQAEHWVAERLGLIFGEYELQRVRAGRARLIAARG
jgi:hypothetical protein